MERFQDSAFRHIKKGDTLIICGDFGFLWEGTAEEKKALKKLEKKKYEILFVDGIHENFDLLESYPEEEYAGGRVHRIGTNLRHLMRGEDVYKRQDRFCLSPAPFILTPSSRARCTF